MAPLVPLPMAERVLLISPVRDEADRIEAVIAAVEAQSRPPDLWIAVDDGSSDGTREALEAHARRLPFLRVCATPPGHTREEGDRLAAAAPDRAWNLGLREAGGPAAFTHLGKLDGDIVMPPELLAEMLARFRADPRLGIAGASLLELDSAGGWRPLDNPPEHPVGACRLYSRACFEAIGGMPERMGADAITTAYAKLRGFRAASFAELRVRHLRPHGAAQGRLRGHARHGAYQYVVCYSPAWILLRSLSVAARERPYGLSGAWYAGGAAGAAIRRTPRVQDREFRDFMRSEQRARLGRALRRGARLGRGSPQRA